MPLSFVRHLNAVFDCRRNIIAIIRFPANAAIAIRLCFAAGHVAPLLLKIEPLFDPLRSDARFQNLLQNFKLNDEKQEGREEV